MNPVAEPRMFAAVSVAAMPVSLLLRASGRAAGSGAIVSVVAAETGADIAVSLVPAPTWTATP